MRLTPLSLIKNKVPCYELSQQVLRKSKQTSVFESLACNFGTCTLCMFCCMLEIMLWSHFQMQQLSRSKICRRGLQVNEINSHIK